MDSSLGPTNIKGVILKLQCSGDVFVSAVKSEGVYGSRA